MENNVNLLGLSIIEDLKKEKIGRLINFNY
jgi:hypothetical protein